MADRERLARHFADQAQFCQQMGSPLYGDLLDRAAADIRAGGPVATVLAGHEDAPGSAAMALRLMGGMHRLVLEGSVPALAEFYPSVGGIPNGVRAWPVFRDVVAEHHDEIRRALQSPPQTNEVGRAAALAGGLLHLRAVSALPARLFELGSSAGLNLRADHYRYAGAGTAWGPVDSPVQLVDSWGGVAPPTSAGLQIVERAGCDVAPIDVTDEEGQLLLTSYVWADQVERLARLRGAFAIATRVPARLVRTSAADFVADLEPAAGTLTVLWHSVMWQYVDPDEQAVVSERIGELAAAATEQAPFAHLALEPHQRGPGRVHAFLVTASLWPQCPDERVLATSHPHGIPTRWLL